MDTDPLNLNEAPSWVDNAWAEVVKVILPGRRLPTVGEWDMELIGEFMGRLQAFAKLYDGEIPMGPDVKAEHEQLQKFVDAQPQSKERAAKEKLFLKDLETRIRATNESMPQMMAAALGSSRQKFLQTRLFFFHQDRVGKFDTEVFARPVLQQFGAHAHNAAAAGLPASSATPH